MSEVSAPSIVELRSVTKSLGEHKILKGVSLSIPKGSIFGIVGESGSGKSTLLELIIGFLKPDSGQIRIMHGAQTFTHARNSKDILSICGYSSQKPSLCDDLTVRENLTYFGKLWNIDAATLRTNTKIALDVCNLQAWADLPAITLSNGLRKRLDIACAIIHNPSLLILDDPTAGMDKKASGRIFELIRRISNTGTTVILATSSIDDASELCTKVALLQNSSVIGPFLVNDLRKRLGGPQEIMLQTREGKYRDLAKILYGSKAGMKRAGMRGAWFVAQSDDATKLLHTLLHACKQTKQNITAIQMDRPAVRDALRAIFEVKR